MSDIETKIREEAKRVLESGDVSVVIGWGEGSVPFKTTPVFVSKPEDAENLVWNPACVNNLAVYLPRHGEGQEGRDRRQALRHPQHRRADPGEADQAREPAYHRPRMRRGSRCGQPG